MSLFGFLKKDTKKENHKDLIGFRWFTHIYGHSSIRPDRVIMLNLHKNYIYIKNHEDSSEIIDTIDLKNIIDCYVKTETEIQETTTLPRVVLLGVFAFLAKKTKVDKEEFLILKFKNNDDVVEVVFGKAPLFSGNISGFSSDIRKAKWDYENKQIDDIL